MPKPRDTSTRAYLRRVSRRSRGGGVPPLPLTAEQRATERVEQAERVRKAREEWAYREGIRKQLRDAGVTVKRGPSAEADRRRNGLA